jgi:hypothetical protein
MESREDYQYFLRIEKITKGRIEAFDLCDEIPLGEKRLVILRPTKNTKSKYLNTVQNLIGV